MFAARPQSAVSQVFDPIPGGGASSSGASATFTVKRDGTITFSGNDTGDQTVNWHTLPFASVGDGYWGRVTKDSGSGTATGAIVGAWVQLSSDRTVSLAYAGIGRNWSGRLEIATDSGGTTIVGAMSLGQPATLAVAVP